MTYGDVGTYGQQSDGDRASSANLGQKLAEFLEARIAHWLEKQDVYLLIDAGSTNLMFSNQFWLYLSRLSQKKCAHQLTLTMNNEPVADAYADQHQGEAFSSGTQIRCEVLGGRDAARVRNAHRVENLQSWTSHTKHEGKFIAILGENLIRLDAHRPALPIRGSRVAVRILAKTSHSA